MSKAMAPEGHPRLQAKGHNSRDHPAAGPTLQYPPTSAAAAARQPSARSSGDVRPAPADAAPQAATAPALSPLQTSAVRPALLNPGAATGGLRGAVQPLGSVQVVCRPSPAEQYAAGHARGKRAAPARRPRGDTTGKRARPCSGDEEEEEDGEEDGDAREGGLSDGNPNDGGGGNGSDGSGAAPAGAYGNFNIDRYLRGEECVEYEGAFITRSAFEKLGGSMQAKWYRSIRVVRGDEPIGAWLLRQGLPVLKGQPRNCRPTRGKRAAKQARPSPTATAGRPRVLEPAAAETQRDGGGWVRSDVHSAAEWTRGAGAGGGSGGMSNGAGGNGVALAAAGLVRAPSAGGACVNHWPPALLSVAALEAAGAAAAPWRLAAAAVAAATGPAASARASAPLPILPMWTTAAGPPGARLQQPLQAQLLKAPKPGPEGVDWLGQAWDHYLGADPATTSAAAPAAGGGGPQPSSAESCPAPPGRSSSSGPGTWAATAIARAASASSEELCSANWLGLGLGLGPGQERLPGGGADARIAWARSELQPQPNSARPAARQQQLHELLSLLQQRRAGAAAPPPRGSVSPPGSAVSCADALVLRSPGAGAVATARHEPLLPGRAGAADAVARHEPLLLSCALAAPLAAAARVGPNAGGERGAGGVGAPSEGAAVAARMQLLLASAAVRSARGSGLMQLWGDNAAPPQPVGAAHPPHSQAPVAKDFELRVQQVMGAGGGGAGHDSAGRARVDRYFRSQRATAIANMGGGGSSFLSGTSALGGVPAAAMATAEAGFGGGGGGGGAAWEMLFTALPQHGPAQW